MEHSRYSLSRSLISLSILVLILFASVGVTTLLKDVLVKSRAVDASPSQTLPPRTDIDIIPTKKVLVLEFNPIIDASGKRLTVERGWSDVNSLLTQYIFHLRTNTASVINYKIVKHQIIDDFPAKEDGFKYKDDTYLDCANSGGSKCHNPDRVNYVKILSDYKVCEQLNNGQIDELWLFGGPWFGYAEANMAGPESFDTNGSPIQVGTTCNKNLNIMGFSYERSLSEMVEDLIHRTEGVMTHVNNGWKNNPYSGNPTLAPPPYSNWDRYTFIAAYPTSIDLKSYGVGTMHQPFNVTDIGDQYDWSNKTTVLSNANDWFNFPKVTGSAILTNCYAWNCTSLGYEAWWLNHFPRYLGKSSDNLLNNWWRYVIDYDNSYEPSCINLPEIQQISPVDNYSYIENPGTISLSAHAIFNTCNNTRVRRIYVRDNTLGENYYPVCEYGDDQEDTDFSCQMNVSMNHKYSWIATVNNESHSVQSVARVFTVGNPPIPPPIPTLPPIVESIAIPSNGTEDGWILSSLMAKNVGTIDSTSITFNLGDSATNKQYKSILSFTVPSLPLISDIQNAVIKIKKSSVVGVDPLTSGILGSVVVDFKSGSFGNTALELSDFLSIPTLSSVGKMSQTPDSDGYYTIILSKNVLSYLKTLKGTKVQFRLGFTIPTNKDAKDNYIKFFSGDSNDIGKPQLIVTYKI